MHTSPGCWLLLHANISFTWFCSPYRLFLLQTHLDPIFLCRINKDDNRWAKYNTTCIQWMLHIQWLKHDFCHYTSVPQQISSEFGAFGENGIIILKVSWRAIASSSTMFTLQIHRHAPWYVLLVLCWWFESIRGVLVNFVSVWKERRKLSVKRPHWLCI